MLKVFTYIALLTTICAGVAILYRDQPYGIRIERIDQPALAKEDRMTTKYSAFPEPNVVATVPIVPTPTLPAPIAPPVIAEPIPLPVPRPRGVVRHVKKDRSAAKLRSKWATPADKPFSFGDLFNVH